MNCLIGGIHLQLAVRAKDTIKDNDTALDGHLVLRYASVSIYTDDPEAVRQIRRALAPSAGGAQLAGIVLGARVPTILTSRADSAETRLTSCAVAVLLHYATMPEVKV